MKKTLLISILALLGMTQAVAQEYEYVPFVREGVKWVYYINNYHFDLTVNPAQGCNTCYRTLEIKGDTVINGKAYKAMHKYSGEEINWEEDTVPVYLREEDKVVYGIVPDGKIYNDCPVGNDGDEEMMAKGDSPRGHSNFSSISFYIRNRKFSIVPVLVL